MTVQQWTTLAGHPKASIAEVTKEAKQHLDQHQRDEFENDHWEFRNLRRVKVEGWEKKLHLKRQEAIEKTFPDIKSPPVYLTCPVVPLLTKKLSPTPFTGVKENLERQGYRSPTNCVGRLIWILWRRCKNLESTKPLQKVLC